MGYTFEDLRRAFNDPIRFHNELRKFNSRLYASRYRDQFDVMDAD